MKIKFKNKTINFDEIGETLDVLDCYDSDVEVFGTDENGVEYSAVGSYSCDQLVDIDEGSIEECYV
tara:strand:+ start:190 stop:387 length:198 start_codon:yes stop_codon:yes gene_type:complete